MVFLDPLRVYAVFGRGFDEVAVNSVKSERSRPFKNLRVMSTTGSRHVSGRSRISWTSDVPRPNGRKEEDFIHQRLFRTPS